MLVRQCQFTTLPIICNDPPPTEKWMSEMHDVASQIADKVLLSDSVVYVLLKNSDFSFKEKLTMLSQPLLLQLELFQILNLGII